MRVRIGIQIRPLLWMITPKKEVENKSLATYYKYIFLCFEIVIRVRKHELNKSE